VNRNVNITNVYNNTYVNKTVTVSNVTYANQGVNGAVMAVPQNAMGNGRPVAQAAVRLQANEVASAQVQQGPMVAPQRAAVLSGAAPATATPPAAVMNRSVVARATPPPAPVPFSQQQSALQANPGQPLARTQLNQIQRTSGINPAANTQSVAPTRPMYRQAMPSRAQAGQTAPNPQFNPRVNPGSNSLSSPGGPSSQGPLGLTQPNPKGQVQQNQNGRVNSIQPNVNQPKPATPSPEAPRPVAHYNQAPVSPASKAPPPHQTKRPAKPEEKHNEKKRAD
jgi:hypothetical protein